MERTISVKRTITAQLSPALRFASKTIAIFFSNILAFDWWHNCISQMQL